MTDSKKFKKRVRERMASTGESYTTAKRNIEKTNTAAGPSPTITARPSAFDTRAAFRDRSLEAWRNVTAELLPKPGAVSWTEPADIVDVLRQIAHGAPNNHVHHPDGGGIDLTGASLGREPATIEMDFQGIATVVHAQSLTLHRKAQDPLGEWTYFRLETGPLAPSGIYDDTDGLQSEELVEIEPLRYDDNGKELELPDSARLVERHFGGPFLLLPKGGGYNAIQSTYDGRHTKVSPQEFDAFIRDFVADLHRRDLYGIDLRTGLQSRAPSNARE